MLHLFSLAHSAHRLAHSLEIWGISKISVLNGVNDGNDLDCYIVSRDTLSDTTIEIHEYVFMLLERYMGMILIVVVS